MSKKVHKGQVSNSHWMSMVDYYLKPLLQATAALGYYVDKVLERTVSIIVDNLAAAIAYC